MKYKFGSDYDYYGEYSQAQQGPFKLITVLDGLVFLKHKSRWDLICIEQSFFENSFKPREK